MANFTIKKRYDKKKIIYYYCKKYDLYSLKYFDVLVFDILSTFVAYIVHIFYVVYLSMAMTLRNIYINATKFSK